MLPVEWRHDAVWDLIEISDYLSLHNPRAADKIERLFRESAERLSENPYLNRTGRVSGTREMIPHPNYMIVYRILKDKIEILNIVHTRRNYPG